MNPKALIGSWTFWFGISQILVAIFGYFSGAMDPQASFALIITGFGSIGFRLKTSQPIGSIT